MASEAALLSLAESIADGQAIDWNAVESQAGADDRAVLRQLRIVAELAQLHRSLPAGGPETTHRERRRDAAGAPAIGNWGQLELIELLGRGSFGDVYRAWDRELERDVALKLLRSDDPHVDPLTSRVAAEGRLLARVRHPNVVTVYGVAKHDGRVGLWMELLRGETLEEQLRAQGPLGAKEAAIVGVELCRALAAIHGAGLVHRDVKAQNVMREQGGRIVLMDLGTGREIDALSTGVAGTPLYLAPEIFTGEPASARTDVYSLGVLLYRLGTGSFPVRAGTLDELKAAHAAGKAASLRDARPDLPAAFVRVIERATAREPERRFATAGEMEAALGEAMDAPHSPVTLPAVEPAPIPRPRSWRAWAALAATAVLVAAAVTVAPRFARGPAAVDAKPNAVAVLPLRFISGEADAPYLADALTDQLITTLGQIHALSVTSHRSVQSFTGPSRPTNQEIARRLGVGTIIDGTVAVQRPPASAAGDTPPRVRINIHVIRAGSDTDLWAESFERPLGDLFALEADVARTVAKYVRAALTQAESARLTKAQSSNAAAEQAYFEGLYQLGRHPHGAQARAALESFQRAIRQDPSMAAAHAAAAQIYLRLGFDGEMTQAEARTSALPSARRALELDDQLASAHLALADISFYYDWDWKAADAEYQRAIALDPSTADAQTQYARYLSAAQRFQEAQAHASAARALDPLSADVALTDGLTKYYARQLGPAANALQDAIRLDSSFPGAYFTLGRIHEAQGDLNAAARMTGRSLELAVTPAPSWRVQAIRLQALQGHRDEARHAFARLAAELAAQHKRIASQHEAYLRLALGERDAALELLGRALADRDPGVLWMAVDPRLDALHGDRRFAELLRGLGAP